MTIKIKKVGITFSYHNDEILYRWPWIVKWGRAKRRFHSSLLTRDFNNFRNYWIMVGEQEAILNKRSTKVEGFHLGDVLAKWADLMYPDRFVVTLSGMDTTAKPPEFWNRLSRDKAVAMTSEIVALLCKDLSEAEKLITSINPRFAEAYFVFNGKVIDDNMSYPLDETERDSK